MNEIVTSLGPDESFEDFPDDQKANNIMNYREILDDIGNVHTDEDSKLHKINDNIFVVVQFPVNLDQSFSITITPLKNEK